MSSEFLKTDIGFDYKYNSILSTILKYKMPCQKKKQQQTPKYLIGSHYHLWLYPGPADFKCPEPHLFLFSLLQLKTLWELSQM